MPYNLTNLTSADEISKIIIFSNEVTGGAFFAMMMWAIFFIIIMIMKRFSFIDALLIDSFICTVISVMLAYAGMLSYMHPLIFLFLLAGTFFYKHATKD